MMNIAITMAAEGFPRRAFKVGDIRRMIDVGVLREDEKFELIGGEIVMMAAKGFAHELIKSHLIVAIARSLPAGSILTAEASLQLADDVLVEPDLAVISRAAFKPGPDNFAQPAEVQLAIEIAVSNLSYDRGLKARLYAEHQIGEFWVIDAIERTAWVHTGRGGDGWASIVERGPKDALTTAVLPGFSIRLGEIE
jgi:Uma2 family endonuclease